MQTLTAGQARGHSLRAHGLEAEIDGVAEAAAQLVGLHNTTQSTPFLSLRARLPGFERGHLESRMWVDWELARFRAMRLTMFVFPHDLLELAAAATHHLTIAMGRRWLRDSKLAETDVARIADDVEAALAGKPMTVRDLRSALGVARDVDLPGVVGRMCDAGRLVGGAPPGSWRSSIRRYHRWVEALPNVDLHRWDEAAAQAELVRRYVDSYGPVTIDDIAWWTGMAKQRCRIALETLGLQQVDVAGWPGPLWHNGIAPAEPTASVRALPLLDPYPQGYRNRERLIDPAWNNHVWDRGGNAAATIVLGGRIIGVWQTSDRPEPQVWYHLFAPQPRSIIADAEAELAAAGSLFLERPVDVVEIRDMAPLPAAGGRSAAHPLDGRVHRPGRRDTQPPTR